MIDCQCVFKKLMDKPILDGLDLEVMGGETVVICGPSGAGKTTFLRTLSGLDRIDSGRIVIDGIDISRSKLGARDLKGRVGMLFQHFNLFEHMTVLENISIGPRQILRLGGKHAESEARALIERLGLSGKEEHFPEQLSGGEKQRVALARCLAMRPAVMLFDEPTSALDPGRRKDVADLIQSIKDKNVSIVVVTHDQQFAYQVADRMLSLESGKLVDTKVDFDCCDDASQGVVLPSAVLVERRPAPGLNIA